MLKKCKPVKSQLPVMRLLGLIMVYPLLMAGLSSCQKFSVTDEVKETVPTSSPRVEKILEEFLEQPLEKQKEIKDNPTVVTRNEEGTPLIRGNLKTENLKVSVNKTYRRIRAQGKIKYKKRKSKVIVEKIVDLEGTVDESGIGTLKPVVHEEDANQLQVRGNVTCLEGPNSDCDEVITDIFVKDPETGSFHLAQVQTTNEDAPPKTDSPKKPTQPTSGTASKESPDAANEESDGEGEPDLYVGSLYTDFEKLFDDSFGEDAPSEGIVESGSETSGTQRPYDQAIGSTNKGSLKNPSDLTARAQEAKAPLTLPHLRRGRSYGTFELVELLVNMAFLTKSLDLNTDLQVGDLSQKNGGSLRNSQHVSHQNGLDVDVGYFTREPDNSRSFPNVVSGSKVRPGFLAEGTLNYFLSLFQSADEGIDRIFVNQIIKNELCQIARARGRLNNSDAISRKTQEVLRRLRPWPGHADHFHLRLKCSRYHPRCRQMSEPPAGPGCG